jgi:hypothetical protein
MPRKRNNVPTVTITISTTEGVRSYLDALVSGGLFGKNPAEAAERLVARGLENLLRDGTLRARSGGALK